MFRFSLAQGQDCAQPEGELIKKGEGIPSPNACLKARNQAAEEASNCSLVVKIMPGLLKVHSQLSGDQIPLVIVCVLAVQIF